MLMLLIILCDDFQTGSSQRRVELDVDGMDGEDLFPFCFPQGLWVGNMKTMTFLKSPTGRSGLFGGLDSVRRPPVDNNWARHFLSIKILFCHTCFFWSGYVQTVDDEVEKYRQEGDAEERSGAAPVQLYSIMSMFLKPHCF